MQLGRTLLVASALLLTAAVPSSALSHLRRGPTSPKPLKHVKAAKSTAQARPRGISDDRAVEIQTALIKSGYMNGEASGHWDSQSEAAMQKLQADNGWQTKLIPDARALIKLGLGPKPEVTSEAVVGPTNIASEANQ